VIDVCDNEEAACRRISGILCGRCVVRADMGSAPLKCQSLQAAAVEPEKLSASFSEEVFRIAMMVDQSLVQGVGGLLGGRYIANGNAVRVSLAFKRRCSP
jgi:hypothetical protein